MDVDVDLARATVRALYLLNTALGGCLLTEPFRRGQ